MMRSLYSGVSGLKNHQTRMDIIGNNIANVNTAGFKASRVVFQDVYSQMTKSSSAPSDTTIGGTNSKQIGLGVNLAAIDIIHSSAATQRTDGELDLAIYGDGFFVVRSAEGDLLYSRAGNLYVDVAGNLVNTSGCMMQGLQAETYVIKKATYNADGSIKEPATVLYNVAAPANQAPAYGGVAKPDPNAYPNGTSDSLYITAMETYLTAMVTYSNDLKTFADALFIPTATFAPPTQISTNPGDANFLIDVQVYAQQVEEYRNFLDQYLSLTNPPAYTGSQWPDPTDPAYPGGVADQAYIDDLAQYWADQDEYKALLSEYVSLARPPEYTGAPQPDPTDPAIYPGGVGDPAYIADLAQYQRDQAAYRDSLDRYKLWLDDPTNLKSADHPDFLNPDGTFNSDKYEVITGVMPSWFGLKSSVDADNANNWTLVERSSAVNDNVLREEYFTNLNVKGFTGITFDEKGFIKGLDENGKEQVIGVLPIATFTNTGGLDKKGSSLYAMSSNSGVPIYNQASTGGAGTVNSGGLEMSNVDLANEFTDMIVTQRGYQASSRLITVSDTMLEELINLKR